jgi:hypothetical protein
VLFQMLFELDYFLSLKIQYHQTIKWQETR